MSQSGIIGSGGAAPVEITFNADVGSATTIGQILNVSGGNNISTSGAGNTLTIAVSGTTNNAVQIGNASGSLTSVGPGTDGQLLIGATGLAPAFANLLSSGSTISITNGPNSINLDVNGSAVVQQLDGDTGSATPTAGVIDITGGNNITTSAAGSAVTVDVSGGTDGQVMIAATAGSPTFANITSSDASITITNGANTIDLITAFAPAYVFAYHTGGGAVGAAYGTVTYTAIPQLVGWSQAANIFTCNTTGTYEINYSVTFGANGDQDTISGSVRLSQDTGGGFAAITGSQVAERFVVQDPLLNAVFDTTTSFLVSGRIIIDATSGDRLIMEMAGTNVLRQPTGVGPNQTDTQITIHRIA